MNGFTTEWKILQNQYDSYEKYALVIKLFAIFIFFLGFTLSVNYLFLALTMAALWLQDAIWKTFQSRIEDRLYIIEAELALTGSEEKTTQQAFQFNRQFLANRKSGLTLIKEYVCQALRPTIAYPYVLLLVVTLSLGFLT